MDAIEILMKEHESILKMIKITRTMLAKHDETSINLNHVEQIIEFIKDFADKYHHIKEEDVLFLEMENKGMSKDSGPIGVMLHEHELGRTYIKNTTEGINSFKNGNNQGFAQIKENLRNYCDLLTNHIYKEDTILYPMATRLLSKDLINKMTNDFVLTNSNTENNEYYDKYLKLVDDFSDKYL